ncbi:MAG: hypothetical protein NZ583_02255 [Desulfobacterota bacterium]|nr:hypothetical protein [Thermodesulfobacteriota bacterium]MDW8001707.1 hypothetical protein [Deltaproteobacteria bacterium]
MELTKLERPSLDKFTEKKKLYCVNHIFISRKDEEFKTMLDRYWTEIDEHLRKLEVAGRINKIFIEGLIYESDESVSEIKEINENLYNLLKKRIDEGGKIVPIEDRDTFSAFVDLRNCLFIVKNKEVYEKLYRFFKEVAEKRFASIKKAIMDALEEKESALLIMDEHVRSVIDFPEEIEIFLVVPPSYDDIMKYLRSKR